MSFTGIVISVIDGQASAALSGFGITILGSSSGAVTLSWTAPTEYEDMTPLMSDLRGFNIYYGQAAGALPNSMTIDNAGVTVGMVENLSSGTWFFAVTAFDTSFNESVFSNIVSATVSAP
jgi:hypothetical protein